MTRLDSEAALATGLAELRARDPAIDRAVRDGSVPALRLRPGGLGALVGIVVGQQVSLASAAAILGRLEAAVPGLDAAALAAADDATLLGAGLSRAKLRTIRALAEAVGRDALDFGILAGLPAEEAHAALRSHHGIGPWTADLYLFFCLGHPDIMPSGDLALQEAARLLLDLPARPDAKALAALAERWAPWRGVAALVLWAHYRRLKGREGAT